MIECRKVGLRDLNKAEYGEGGGGDKMIHLHAKKTEWYYILVRVNRTPPLTRLDLG